MKNITKLLLIIGALNLSAYSFAEAPVVELENIALPEATSNQADSNLQNDTPYSLRMRKLEQQMQNMIKHNVIGQIEALHDQLQELQGKLSVLSHKVDKLKKNQKEDYKDLEDRLTSKYKKNGDKTSAPITEISQDTDTGSAIKLYQEAFNALQQQMYKQADLLFHQFIKQYPLSERIANAHYWLGEMYYVKGDKAAAIKQLQTVVEKYPKSAKMSAAQLKLALIAIDEDKLDEATKQLKLIIKENPNSAAAIMAKRYLDQLKK